MSTSLPQSWALDLVLPEGVYYGFVRDGTTPTTPRLSPAELASLGPERLPRRVAEFAKGRSAARMALRQLGFEDWDVLRGADRAPIWPADVVGSITHSGDQALALVALREHSSGIGVDLEQVCPTDDIVEFVAFGDELAQLERLDSRSRDRWIIELFAAKESIFKAFYPKVRSFFGFDAVRLSKAPDAPAVDAKFVHGLNGGYPTDMTFQVQTSWHGDEVLAWLVLPRDRPSA